MAEITWRRAGELLRGLFEILSQHPDGMPARDALAELASQVPPTEFESADYPKRPGVRRYEKLVRFQSINTVKAGWLNKQDGRWFVTEEGLAALRKYPNGETFMLEARRLYKEWERDQPTKPDSGDRADAGGLAATAPDASILLEEAEDTARASIEDYIQTMNGYEFQKLVAALLRGMGYHVNWVAPRGADDGIDIVAYSDPLGVSGPRIKVQVKQREGKADADALRSFMAVLAEQDTGIFVSAGGFTSIAEREARKQEKRKLTLLDLARIVELWISHYENLSPGDRSLLPLRPVHYLATGPGPEGR